MLQFAVLPVVGPGLTELQKGALRGFAFPCTSFFAMFYGLSRFHFEMASNLFQVKKVLTCARVPPLEFQPNLLQLLTEP